MEVMLKSLAQKKVDLFILLYFSKAFGTLNHNITVIRLLLVTLHYYYFMVSATKLIKSYLSAFAWVIRSVHRRHLTVIAFFFKEKINKDMICFSDNANNLELVLNFNKSNIILFVLKFPIENTRLLILQSTRDDSACSLWALKSC